MHLVSALAWQLRDFLNPHLLVSHPSLSTNHTNTPSPTSPSHLHIYQPATSPGTPNNSQNNSPHLRPPSSLLPPPLLVLLLFVLRIQTLHEPVHRFHSTSNFFACPKVIVCLQRLQQWRHLFKELTLCPGVGLQIEECLLSEAVWLVQLVRKRLGLPGVGVLLYGMGQCHSGPASLRSATDIHNHTYIIFLERFVLP